MFHKFARSTARFPLSIALTIFMASLTFGQAAAPDRFKQFDKNGDGKLTADELNMSNLFGRLDKDNDGFVTEAEFTAFSARRSGKSAPPVSDKPVDPSLKPRPHGDEATKAGLKPDVLARLDLAMQQAVADKEVSGVIGLIHRNGQRGYFENFGWQDIEAQKSLARDAIFRLQSMSKPVVTVAALTLLDEGKFTLDEPISKHLPEWKEPKVLENGKLVPARSAITPRMLMSHSSGLYYGNIEKGPRQGNAADIAASRESRTSLAAHSKALAARPLKFHPGESYSYGTSIDVLGRYIEVVAGKPLDEVLQERVLGPLKMVDTDFWVHPENASRICQIYKQPQPGVLERGREAAQLTEKPTIFLGGQGLCSTTADYERFCRMMMNRGELDGVRVLKPETLDLMFQNHLKPGLGQRYGLGGAVDGEVGYSWGGANGTQFWIDRKDQLFAIFMVQTQLYRAPTYGTFKQLVNESAGIAGKGGTGAPGQGQGGGGGMSNLFKQRDKNNDGKLSRDEIPAALFDRLDLNKDGVVTPDEAANRNSPPAAAETLRDPTAKTTAAESGDLLSLLSKPAIDLLVVVSDLDRSVKFYGDGIGMKPVGERAKLADGSSFQRLQWGQTMLHLVAPATPPAQGPKVANAGDDVKQQIIAANGLRLIYLLVDDKEGILDRMKARGIAPEGGVSAAGSYELFADPDGNPVAIQSTAPRRGGQRRPPSLQMAHTVSDDAVARKFFGETLGLPAAGSIPLRSMGATEYRHAVGESVIKFWAPTVTKRESLGGPVLERLGARAVIFPVRDLATVKTMLASRGLKSLEETVPALGEKPALIIPDLDGNRILFLEQPVTGEAPKAAASSRTTDAAFAAATPNASFERYDRNKDGAITADELRNEQIFARLDANKDGKVSREEAQRVLGSRGAAPEPAAAPSHDVRPRTPTNGGPLLFDGTPGDATNDAAGETQLFEQTFIKGITDVPVPAQGMAWVDLNRDGKTDLVIVEKERVRALVNQGGFKFSEHPLHLDGEVTGSQAPTFADFNGDGFLDFYLSTVGGRNRANLFIAQGAWDHFKDFAVPMGVENAGAYARGQVSLGDVNGDGWLDMAIAANQIGSGGPTAGRPLSRLYVFRPESDGVFEHGWFEDVGGTEVIPRFGGVDREKPDRDRDINGMSAVLRDLDDDSAPDLIRAAHNDMLRGDPLSPFATGDRPYGVFAWRNEFKAGGALKFTELMPGPGSFTEHGRSRWNATGGHYVSEHAALAAETILPADIDNDGDLDLLITGITGPEVIVHSLWTAARVWRNDGGMKFTDITESSGLGALNWFADQWAKHWGDTLAEDGRANAKRGDSPLPRGEQKFALKDHQLYFGNSTWADFNNDGWIDLLQVSRFNGRQSIRGSWRSNLFLNRGNGTFDVVTTQLSGINEMALAAQAVDVDGDGKLEAVLMRREEKNPQTPVIVYWNTGRQFGANDNHWLRVNLTGLPQRQLIGAKLLARTQDGKLLGRRDYTVDCMRGSHDADLHFGCGKATAATIEVVLPNQTRLTVSDVKANQVATIDARTGALQQADFPAEERAERRTQRKSQQDEGGER